VADADLVEFLGIDSMAMAFALKRSFQVARDELCRQLAYDSMGEPADATSCVEINQLNSLNTSTPSSRRSHGDNVASMAGRREI
jgi:hypothetical protein